MSYSIKQGDTLPAIELHLTDGTGSPINLEGYSVTVTVASKLSPIPLVHRSATILDASKGHISLEWRKGETDLPGTYFLEVTLTDENNDSFTIPGSGYGLVTIAPKLAR